MENMQTIKKIITITIREPSKRLKLPSHSSFGIIVCFTNICWSIFTSEKWQLNWRACDDYDFKRCLKVILNVFKSNFNLQSALHFEVAMSQKFITEDGTKKFYVVFYIIYTYITIMSCYYQGFPFIASGKSLSLHPVSVQSCFR